MGLLNAAPSFWEIRMFLTPQEIAILTGYVRQKDQRSWLDRNKWKFEITRTGHPVVLRKHAESKLSEAQENKPEWSPNFDALRKVA